MKPEQRIATLLVSALMVIGAAAQAPPETPAVDVSDRQVYEHRIGTNGFIHTDHSTVESIFRNTIDLDVVVGIDGHVESARAVNGRRPFYSQAESVEREQQFKPFEEDGRAVRAHFTDSVRILPPEQWGQKTAFPPIRDWNSLRITLARSGCFGSCPAYQVQIRGDGTVIWHGNFYVLITGEHKSHISKDEVKELVQAFRKADYFSLKDRYETSITDCPSFKTAIEFDGHAKSVVDYVGLESGMPVMAAELESTIDDIAATDKWIRETDDTWQALLDEGWDFKSQSEQNRSLFANVAAMGSSELAAEFLAAGAPAVAMDQSGVSALQEAAGRGDLQLVKRMVESANSLPPSVMFLALGRAAQSGNLEIVRLLIEKGADVNGASPDPKDKQTVLMDAAMSGNPEVVGEILLHHPEVDAREKRGQTALMLIIARSPEKQDITEALTELLAAGADVNARDQDGETALFAACSRVSAVKVLASAGADLNARNRDGQTALMTCFQPEFAKAMLEAGADPSVRNREGLTAAEASRKFGAKEKADLIDAFVNKRQYK